MGLRSIGEIFCVKWMCIDNFEKSDDYIICLFLFCISNQISSSSKDKICGENPQKVHTGVFSLSWSITRCCFLGWATWQNRDCKYLEEIKIAFIFAEQSFFSTFTKISRLTSEDIQGWNKHPKGITWRNDFRSQFVIVIFNTKSKLEKKSHAKPLHCDQWEYKFIQIDIRCVHLLFLNKCSRWDSVWWDGSRWGEAGTIFQHWRISFPGFYSCIQISGLENILSQKKKEP